MANFKRTRGHQIGNFSVELALVLVLACGFFYFVSDLSGQLIRQSRLDTVVYTVSNIVKERSKLFDGYERNWISEQGNSEYQLLDDIALMLLSESDSQIQNAKDFGISIEMSGINDRESELLHVRKLGATECHTGLNPFLYDFVPAAPETNHEENLAYRVSICVKTSSIFSQFYGSERSLLLRSFAILPGRFFDVEG
ncbi:hypothetical protein H4F17_03445 [Vibrio cholerae]